MIKEKIYNYAKAKERGYSFEDFMSSFTENVNEQLIPENVQFEGMDKFVKEIQNRKDSKFAIVGDYDVDGITASAILYKALTHLNYKVTVILPNRHKDGYGLSPNLVDEAINQLCSSIITVDNGINASPALRYAKEKHISCFVTDHHVPNDDFYKDYTPYVINPHITKSNLKTKEVCGAYVALVLALKILEAEGSESKTLVKELKELASIGTVADVMPIKKENQTLLFFAEQHWKKGIAYNKGLRTLITSLGKFAIEDMDQENIGFYLSPCLNASGRLGSADTSFRLLVTDDNLELCSITLQIISQNVRRQKITTEASQWLKDKIIPNIKVQVIQLPKGFGGYSNEELEGVIGLLAQKCVDLSGCPSLIFLGDKFSGRSVIDVDLQKLISLCKIESLSFGGHKGACGGKIDFDYAHHAFMSELDANIEKARTEEVQRLIRVPESLSIKEMCDTLQKLKPCDKLPDLFYENLVGDSFGVMSEKHSNFNTKINGKTVKVLKFNDVLPLKGNEEFEVLKLIFKPTKNFKNGYDLIAQKLIIGEIILPF